MKAILCPIGVSVGATIRVTEKDYVVKNVVQVLFIYHSQTSRVSFRVGEKLFNQPQKLNELLTYSGYDNVKDMFKDHGKGVEFVMSEGKLILYLLEFTEERFNFM